MTRRLRLVTACTLALLPISLHAQQAAQPLLPDPVPEAPKNNNLPDENFIRSQRAQRDNARHQNTGVPDAGAANLEDIVELAMDGELLKMDLAGGGTGQSSQRFTVKGADALITVSRSVSSAIALGNGMIRPPSTSISLNRVDLNVQDDQTIWQASASQSSTYLSISGQSVLGRITFSQNNASRVGGVVRAQPVRVTVYEWQAGPRLKSIFTASADTVEKLRVQNPVEFRKYVVPLFRKFSDMRWIIPGASDAYGVFSEIAADPQAIARVQALLPELNSDAYAVRESAGRQLLDLGPAGVLAALRMDADSLSDEQKGQLGRLIAAHRRRAISSPDEARKDPAFLTDCLEHDDPAVRTAAKASLEKILGKPLDFDPKLEGESLMTAADQVRRQVQELLPATRPADEPAPVNPAVEIAPRPAVIEPQILIR